MGSFFRIVFMVEIIFSIIADDIFKFIYIIVGFISSCLVQPIMINECTEDADIDALHGSDDRALRFKRTLFSNPKVHSIVRHLLPIFDKKGLLDI